MKANTATNKTGSKALLSLSLMIISGFVTPSCAQAPKENATNALQQGTPTAEKTVTIPVKGMSCGACVANVKRHVAAVKGVQAVQVSLEKREATVTYTAGTVSPEQLVKTINGLGYQGGKPVDAIKR